MVGQNIAHYRVSAKLGAGGMGEVYRATDTRLGREVAIKVLPSGSSGDPEAREQQMHEARMVSALHHPNIATLFEVGEFDGGFFIAMELVEGSPLSEIIPNGGIAVPTLIGYGSQVARALEHAHSRGVVHRDLKCANIMVSREGQAKVLDFGLSQRISGPNLQDVTQSRLTLSEVRQVAGTLPYMAPEQLRGEPADARTDIWALGVVLFEMAAGLRPFAGRTGFELSSAILREPPRELPANVPAGLRAVVQKCLAKEPSQRYQRAGEALAALEAIQADTQTATVLAPLIAPPRRRLLWIAATLLMIAFLAIGANVGGLRDRIFRRGATAPIQSLAVLPLDNLSGDAAEDYFAEAMTEELTNEMASLRSLRVISRTSASQYRATKKPLREVAAEMGVDALIEGSVLRAGDRVRVTVQLIDGATDRHLWSRSYDRASADVMGLQRDVARAIAQEIQLSLSPAEEHHLEAPSTRNPKAYEAYLHARYRLNYIFRSPEDPDAAIQFAEQAIALDPNFAEAYVAVAKGCQGKIFAWKAGTDYDEKAFVMLGKALGLNPNLAEAYHVRGELYYTRLHSYDFIKAISDYRHALALNPNLVQAHHALGGELTHLGLHEQAAQEFRTTLKLDPNNAGARLRLGRALWQQQKFAEALEVYNRYDVRNSERATTLAFLGRQKEAWEASEQVVRINPSSEIQNEDILAARTFFFAREGKPAEAMRAAIGSIKIGGDKPHFHHAAFILAAANAEMSRAKEAVAMLRRAADGGMPNYPLFRDNPSMKRLHGNPEYEKFMSELKERWDRIVAEVQPGKPA